MAAHLVTCMLLLHYDAVRRREQGRSAPRASHRRRRGGGDARSTQRFFSASPRVLRARERAQRALRGARRGGPDA